MIKSLFLIATIATLSNGILFSGGQRGRGGGRGRFPSFGDIFGTPVGRNITFTELTCAADVSPPVTCGRRGNATGILACRTRQGRFGRSSNTTLCVDPSRGREGDVCGCCLDEMDRCPTEPCGCPCNIMDRNGNVIGTGVNVTFAGRSEGGFGGGRGGGGGRFGGLRRRRRGRAESKCVSLEDSVTLQLFRGMECVANTPETCPPSN